MMLFIIQFYKPTIGIYLLLKIQPCKIMTFLFIIFGLLFKSHLTKCTLVPERIIEIVKPLDIQVVFILPLYLTDSIQLHHRSLSSLWWDEASNSCTFIYLHHRSVIRISFARNTIISLKAKLIYSVYYCLKYLMTIHTLI